VARVYSTRFLFAKPGDAAGAYVVPAGKRAVLKAVSAHSGGSAGDGAFIRVGSTTVWYWASPGANTMDTKALMVVFYAGELLELFAYGQYMSIAASGYLFDDPGTATTLPAPPQAGTPPPWPPWEAQPRE
jgi:hypothetical protein